jgi:hypothetical protein
MLNVVMGHVNVQTNMYLMKIKYAVSKWIKFWKKKKINFIFPANSVDPCPAQIPAQARIRYPGNCRRFIDCELK